MTNKSLTQRIHERNNAVFSLMPSIPDKMAIEVTNICNHRCIFCPSSRMTRKKVEIDEYLFNKILVEAYELGVRQLGFHITGEPFVCKNLAKYIKKAKDMGFTYAYVTSNGSLATPKRLEEVFEAGLDSIKFSINAGTRDTYKQIHGNDHFETVRDNLRFCHEYRKQHNRKFNIFISCIVTKYIMSETDALKKAFAEFADEIVFYKARNFGGTMPENAGLLENGLTKLDRCISPFNALYITCEGFLSPCCVDAENNLVVGDLNKESLKEAWYGERMTELRQKLMNNDVNDIQCGLCLRGGGAEVEVLDL